jgi:hypothetical protein
VIVAHTGADMIKHIRGGLPILAGLAGLSGVLGCGGPASAPSGQSSSSSQNPEIDYTQTKTITMESFTVPAGGEVYYCQNFANPWGEQVDIKEYSLDMSVGSHHMFAFYASNATDGSIEPCPEGGLQFGTFTFTAQQPKVDEIYPATVGATVPKTTGFQMMVHYLNTTSTPLPSTRVTLTMNIAKPGVVTQHAGVLYLNDVTLVVPPGTSTSHQSYTLPQDVNIMSSDSHMHQKGTNFVATASSGETLFTTTEWSEPPSKIYSPPMQLKSGTSVSWSCTYDNMTDATLTFGQSATKNVMCISVSIFYPVSDVTNPVLGSAITGGL